MTYAEYYHFRSSNEENKAQEVKCLVQDYALGMGSLEGPNSGGPPSRDPVTPPLAMALLLCPLALLSSSLMMVLKFCALNVFAL